MTKKSKQRRLAASLIGVIGLSALTAQAEAPRIQYEMVPHVVIPQTIEYKPTPKRNGNSATEKGFGADYGVTSPYVATYVPFPSYSLPYPTAFYPVNNALYPVTQAAVLATQQAAQAERQHCPWKQANHETTPAKDSDVEKFVEEVVGDIQANIEKSRNERVISLVSATEEENIVHAVNDDSQESEIVPTGLFGGESSSAWSFSSPLFKVASIPSKSLHAGGAINQNGPRCQTAVTIPTSPYPPTPEYNIMMPQYYQLPNGMVMPVQQRQGLFKRFCHPQQQQFQFQLPPGTAPQMPGCYAPQAMMPYGMPQQAMMPPMMPYQQAYYGMPGMGMMPSMMAYQQPMMPYPYYAMPYGMPYGYGMPQQPVMPQIAQQLPITQVGLESSATTPVAPASLPSGMGTPVMSLGMNGQNMPMMLVQMSPQQLPQAGMMQAGTATMIMTPQGPQMALLAPVNPPVAQPYAPAPQKLDSAAEGESKNDAAGAKPGASVIMPSLNPAISNGSVAAVLSMDPQMMLQQAKVAAPFEAQGQSYYMLVPCNANGSFCNPMQQPQAQQNNNGITMTELALLIAALKDDRPRNPLRERIAARREQRRSANSADPLTKLMETWSTPSYPSDTAMRMPSKNAYPYGYFGATVGPQQTACFGGYYDGYVGSTGYPAY